MPRFSLPVLSVAALLTLLCTGAAGASPGVHALSPLSPRPRSMNPFAAPGPSLAQAKAAAPAPAATSPGPIACTDDNGCPDETICTDRVCRPLDRPIRALLFRKEGPKTAFWPFYFSRTGTPGHRVVAPVYWHFWSHEDKARVVAPFYFHFEDYVARSRSTAIWVGPVITWSKQPDASSWGVWPLVYRSTKFGWAAPLLGSFKYENPDRGQSFGLYAFLYYWSRDRQDEQATDVVFPLVWSFRSKHKATTVGFPLLYSWRRNGTTNTLFLPLFFRSADARNKLTLSPLGYSSWAGSNHRGSHLWLYWYGRNKGRDDYDVLFPLLWSFRNTSGSATVFFPLVWHFGDKDGHTTVAGPYVDIDGANNRFRSLFPLLFMNRSKQEKSSWGLLLPLAFWSHDEDSRKLSVVTPLGGYAHDRKAGTSGLTMWLPPIVTRRTPQSSFHLVFPLFYRSEDKMAQSHALWTLLYYSQEDPEGSTSTVFPLFWRFRDKRQNATATAFLPFVFHRNAPDDKLTAVGAGVMGYYRDRGAAGGSAGLFPLAFFGRHHDRRHAVVFPLLWHFSSKDRGFTLALPLFARWRNSHEATTAIFPLLYFQGHTPEWNYKVQLPLFWHLHNRHTDTRTTVLGPGFLTRKQDGWSGGLFPLVFAGKSSHGAHAVVAPLFWHFRNDDEDRSRTVVGPYYHGRHGGERTDALFPLLYYRRGARPGGADETSFTLFPLVHFKRTPQSRTFVTPIGAGTRTEEGKAGFVGPYFWYESKNVSASGAVPLFWDITNKQAQQRTRLLGPWVAIDQPGMRARFLFPFWGGYTARRDDGVEERGTYVFPTFFHQRNSDGYALDALFPLFWRSRGPGLSSFQLGPYFTRTTDTTQTQGLLPLYFYRRTPKSSLLLTPLGYRHNDFRVREATTWMGLLFYRNSHRHGDRTVLFPLWFSGRNRHESHQVLFPLFWRFANDKERTSTAFLGPLFARRNGGMKTYGLFPLLWIGRDKEKDAGSTALLPLFYRSFGRDRSTLLTPVFGTGRSPRSSWWYVPPVYRRTTATTSTTALLPLGFQHTNRATDTTTRAFLPLLHFSRSSPERALSSWLGVFWHRRGIASSTSVLFPLFFDHHSFHDTRTTAVLPLLLRHNRAADDTTYWFGPLFYRRANPKGSTTIVLPLYWDWKGEGRRSQFLFPLFAHLERATWKGTYVFPNIWYRTGKGADVGTSRLFIFPFWESEVKRPGDYLWEVLLGLVGYERAGRNRFLKLFFIPFEMAPVPRTTQTASWYGRPPRARRLPEGRGFSGHVW